MDLSRTAGGTDYSRGGGRHVRRNRYQVSPWFVVDSNDKRRARLNIISHFLDQIPYKALPW